MLLPETTSLFDDQLCKNGSAFCNKIWNAFRLVKGWEVNESLAQPEASKLAVEWFDAKLKQAWNEIEDHYSKFRLNDALMVASNSSLMSSQAGI